jgi:hypothetical protein
VRVHHVEGDEPRQYRGSDDDPDVESDESGDELEEWVHSGAPAPGSRCTE